MQDKLASSRLALDQRTLRFEQALQGFARRLKSVPLRTWQFLVILLLVIWLSHSLARLFWMLVPSPSLPPATVSVVAGHAGATDNLSGVDIQSLKGLDIFGQARQSEDAASEAAALPPPEETDTAVDTQLNLVLVGVVASNDEDAGRAIIASGGQQDVYAPGAELPAGRGVTLTRVMDQRVILNNNGRLESLWLHQENTGSPRRATQQYVAPPEPMVSRSWSEENEYIPADEAPPPVHVEHNPEYQEAGPAADPAAEISRNISDVVAMSIHREGGQVVGYKIRPGRNAAQFTALGLQPDDIVTAVNGVPLDNPGKIMEIYRNMSNATSASLEIRRGGSVISVDIVLQ